MPGDAKYVPDFHSEVVCPVCRNEFLERVGLYSLIRDDRDPGNPKKRKATEIGEFWRCGNPDCAHRLSPQDLRGSYDG